ncbi:MAG: recombinase family protein, partial [Firmicutes bacterium]|nr:recombinase family protein [Bacillota bacterium]
MLVFGYVRVSTDNQLENYSIEEQTDRLKAYCQAKGWTLLHIYVDGGYSGGNTDRPALQEMLNAITQNHVDAVVVYKLDRLSRSQKDTLTLIEDKLLANHTDFVSINENFDTSTPFGKAMIGMLSVFAQLEKDQITERFTMGRIGRSKAGYFHGGANAPTGYDYQDGMLTVNEYEAMQVRQVFDLFLAGKSINAIYKQLAAQYTTKWSAAKVRNVLQNSIYIGKVQFLQQEYQGI